MVDIRRLVFTKARISSLLRGIKNGTSVPKWANEGRAVTENGTTVLYIGDLRVVSTEEQEAWLRKRLYDKSAKPISFARDAGYDAIQKESLGVSRRAFYAFLSSQAIHQKSAARPKPAKTAGQKVYRRGLIEIDLVEVKPKDVKTLGRTKSTYIYVCVDKLTSYMVCTEIKTKVAVKSRDVLSKLLDQMEGALGKKVYRIQSDAGGEFMGAVLPMLEKRGIKKEIVKLGPAVESRNRFLQAKLYNLIRQRRGGTFAKLLEEARTQCNETKSRITGFSPTDALAQKDSVLADRFNNKRQAPGKDLLPKVSKGSLVRVLKKARKADKFYKSYRATHYSAPYTVTAVRGRSFTVNGKTYPRDRLLLVPKVDQKSLRLIEERSKRAADTPEQKAQKSNKRKKKRAEERAKNVAQPRRSSRAATKQTVTASKQARDKKR